MDQQTATPTTQQPEKVATFKPKKGAETSPTTKWVRPPSMPSVFPDLSKLAISASNWAELQKNYLAARREVARLEASQYGNELFTDDLSNCKLLLEAEVKRLKKANTKMKKTLDTLVHAGDIVAMTDWMKEQDQLEDPFCGWFEASQVLELLKAWSTYVDITEDAKAEVHDLSRRLWYGEDEAAQ